jgi:TatD DNase family protein
LRHKNGIFAAEGETMQYVNAHTHRLPPEGTLAVTNLDKDAVEIPSEGLWSAGIHPWFICEETLEQEMARLRGWMTHPRVVAVGECGLDRLARTPLALQQNVFLKQLDMAREFLKPVIIHNVRAGSELLQIRKGLKDPTLWLIHGFHGSQREAELLVQQGCFLGFGKMLLNPNSRAVKACEAIPMQWILPETDDAPLGIETIVSTIARIKKLPVDEVGEALFDNFARCFKWQYHA